MSLYEATKDALKLAQKSDNAELIHQILDVQAQALEMQEKQFQLNKKIEDLNKEILELKAKKNYKYENDHKWIINPENPEIKLCPTCLNRDNFESPLGSMHHGIRYCGNCKNSVS